ncbi:MAG: 16S rRNA (guanine(966)-N(2))-methyltransferase RsmD [Bacteroidia bacterium]|nr:16S rRNA (guanine(966)-N(2))-methyltransferase RsmD [Bacteroidia bacterium]
MRIIGGKYGGRQIQSPKGLPVRPTTDRTKEALFNILQHRIYWEECKVLDLFSGTGNISLECLSRGAMDVVSVDRERKCIEALKKAKMELGIKKGQEIRSDVVKYLRQTTEKFDFIFMDPPYAMKGQESMVETILQNPLLEEDGLLVVEHASQNDFSGMNSFESVRKYGSSSLSFFSLS